MQPRVFRAPHEEPPWYLTTPSNEPPLTHIPHPRFFVWLAIFDCQKTRCGAERLCVSEQDLVAPLQLLHDFGVMQDDEGVDDEEGSMDGGGSSGGRRPAAATSPLRPPLARVYPRVRTTGSSHGFRFVE